MNLEESFNIISEQMKLDWEKIKVSLEHSGNKGASLENIFHEFLRKYLPENLDFSKGEILDSNGNHSKQLDVIIFDKFKTIKLFSNNEIRIIPIECVYFVIEIKSNIDSEKTVLEIIENMQSVKKLEKTAYVTPKNSAIIQSVSMYGEDYAIWPVNYFVFSIDSISLDHLTKFLSSQQSEFPISKRIDLICVLNKGVISNKLSSGIFNAIPEPNSVLSHTETKKSLLLFYALISRYSNEAWIPKFNIVKYLKNGFGKEFD